MSVADDVFPDAEYDHDKLAGAAFKEFFGGIGTLFDMLSERVIFLEGEVASLNAAVAELTAQPTPGVMAWDEDDDDEEPGPVAWDED